MPEKKPVPPPVPPPAPRNRHERRKRATEERRARPWLPRIAVTTMTGEWFTHSPGCKPVFDVIRDGMGEMDKPSHTITSVSLVTITPEIVAKVAEKTGRTVDAVNAYLAGPEQDAVLLDAFLFFGVGPVGKVPSEPVVVPAADSTSKRWAKAVRDLRTALGSGGIVTNNNFTPVHMKTPE